jgi:hypothetical protein
MLSIVEGCKKFHNLIYGLKVNVQTDHKPLVSVFQKPVSKIGSSRLQCLRLKILKYTLDVQYIPGKQMYVADLLSRDYIKKTVMHDPAYDEMVHSICRSFSYVRTANQRVPSRNG